MFQFQLSKRDVFKTTTKKFRSLLVCDRNSTAKNVRQILQYLNNVDLILVIFLVIAKNM